MTSIPDLKERLKSIGLSSGEAEIYLSLLKSGSSTVNDVKKETNLNRTGIYDYLDKLLKKGLVSFTVQQNIRYYKPIHPEKFLEILEEKQNTIKDILPALQTLNKLAKRTSNVEVTYGLEGIKNFLADIIRTGKNYECINIDEEEWEKKFPYVTANHIKREKKANIKWKAITYKETKFTYKTPQAEYRFLDQKSFSPLNTIIYGDNVAVIIHDPLSVITIRNKDLAKAYSTHFEFLWKIAKK